MNTCISLKSVLLSLLIGWKTNSTQANSNDVVKTSSGSIQGSEVEFTGHTVKQYLGIPFANPPVGLLRFKKPEPVEPWEETLVADGMPPTCIQYADYPFPWYDSEDGKSEDCLYLNIWAPSSSYAFSRPVIFWIYDTGFTFGCNRRRVYEGQALAATGKVIVVTVNYRMAAFGFFTSGTDSAPGNVGMYDILEALKWVNKNIAAFGGDPDQVTLTGQSSGSIAIGFLCVSPLTRGLFKRVIMGSGSPAFLFAENNTANIAESQKLAEAVKCTKGGNTIYENPEEVVKCVRDVDALKIAKTLNSFLPTSAHSFYPSFGDEILPKNARTSLIDGEFHNVNVLIGNNRDEGAFQVTASHPEVFGFFGEKDPKINKSYAESMLRDIFSGFEDPDAVIQHYLRDVDKDDHHRIMEQVYTASGDYSLLCPTVYFAESYSKAGNNVFYYYYVLRPSTTKWTEWMGVVHFEKDRLPFGVPFKETRNYTIREDFLSMRMMNIWSIFAKTGRLGIWPLYSREQPTFLPLDAFSYPGEGPHKSNCDFFRRYFGFD